MARIVVDNCTLVNFAAVGELPLLRDTLRDRGCWTQAIEFECKTSRSYYPSLGQLWDEGWLGEPIELDGDQAIEGVQNVRRALSKPRSKPTDNLGEAEAIYAILALPELLGAIFLTDDNPAADYARFKQIQVIHSMNLLSEAYYVGDVGCPAAYELLVKMREADRGVYVPASRRDVCP